MDKKLRKRTYRCRTCQFYKKDKSCSLTKEGDDEYRFPDDYCEFWTLPYCVMLPDEGMFSYVGEVDSLDMNNLDDYPDKSIIICNNKTYLIRETRYRGRIQKTAVEISN